MSTGQENHKWSKELIGFLAVQWQKLVCFNVNSFQKGPSISRLHRNMVSYTFFLTLRSSMVLYETYPGFPIQFSFRKLRMQWFINGTLSLIYGHFTNLHENFFNNEQFICYTARDILLLYCHIGAFLISLNSNLTAKPKKDWHPHSRPPQHPETSNLKKRHHNHSVTAT